MICKSIGWHLVSAGHARLVLRWCFQFAFCSFSADHCSCFLVVGVPERSVWALLFVVRSALFIGEPFCLFFWCSCCVCLALVGPALCFSLMRLVGAAWFASASSSRCRFCFLALFALLRFGLLRSVFVFPALLRHGWCPIFLVFLRCPVSAGMYIVAMCMGSLSDFLYFPA